MTEKDHNFGDILLDEDGLSLPLNSAASSADTSEGTQLPVTDEDMRDLWKVEAELDQRWPETKIDPTMERVELLMNYLGDPHKAYRGIHVAGTNAKTSTVRMIDSLVRALHRRTGRTTSPHLQLPTERIAIDGSPIHPRLYVDTWRDIQPFVEMVDQHSQERGGPAMSKFEVLVGMAYAAFAEAPIDVAVVETGMGGRWDATNVFHSDVSVITPIALDHTDYLGNTLAEIAAEKAGIMKISDNDEEHNPHDHVAIIASQDPEVMEVLLREAIAKDVAVAREGQEFALLSSRIAVGGQQLSLRGLGGIYEDIFLPLSGEYQARNAAIALAAVEAFFGARTGKPLDIDAVRVGFAQVQSPGRLERVRTAPSIFVDATHNPHGAQSLAAALGRDYDFRRLIGVVGILGDKDARGILSALENVLDEIVVTEPQSPRALSMDTLYEYAQDIFGDERVHRVDSLETAVELAVELAEDDGDEGMIAGSGVVITGSVVIAGQARTLFHKEPA